MNRFLAVVVLVMLVLTVAVGFRTAAISFGHASVVMANGGAPEPPVPWKSGAKNGGAPEPPVPWKNGGAPEPPVPW